MIRPATWDDVVRLLEMGRRFYGELDKTAEWDELSAAETVGDLLANQAGVILVAEKNGEIIGMAMAALLPFMLNRSHINAQEIAWWVEPEHRGPISVRLFRAMEKEVRARGAKTLTMVDECSLGDLGPLYERLGFRPDERTYVKAL